MKMALNGVTQNLEPDNFKFKTNVNIWGKVVLNYSVLKYLLRLRTFTT